MVRKIIQCKFNFERYDVSLCQLQLWNCDSQRGVMWWYHALTYVHGRSGSLHHSFKFLGKFATFLLMTDQEISHHGLRRISGSLESTDMNHTTTSKNPFEARTTSFFVYSKGWSHTSLASRLPVAARSMKPRPGSQEGRYSTILTFKTLFGRTR